MSFNFLAFERRLGARVAMQPTHVVPLGLSCRVTYQARTYFGSTTAFPFDWWLTPMAGLTQYLADPDPDRLYSRHALAELVVDGQISTVVAPEFGFQLFHEFPRQDVGLPTRVVAPHWREHIVEAHARHSQRLQRLLALDRPGNRLLFVRDRLHLDDGCGTEPPRDSVARLWRTLADRWSQAEIQLLLINSRARQALVLPRRAAVRQVEFEDLPGTPPEAWRGDSTAWSRAFAAAGYAQREQPAGPASSVGPPD